MSHASHYLVSSRLGLDTISTNCLNLSHTATRVLLQVGTAHSVPFSAVHMQGSENFHQQCSVGSMV